MMSKAMAYIHLSAKMAIERQYCHQKEPLRFFSPLTFMEFVHIFRIISAYIVKLELVSDEFLRLSNKFRAQVS